MTRRTATTVDVLVLDAGSAGGSARSEVPPRPFRTCGR